MSKRKMPDGVKDLGGGRYEIRATWTDPTLANRRTLERIVEAPSPEHAALIRVTELEKVKAGIPVVAARERQTFGASSDGWLEGRKVDGIRPALAPSTQRTYGDAMQAWKTELVSDRWLDALAPEAVEAAMMRWRAEGLGTHSINGRLRVLRTWARETRNERIVAGVRAYGITNEELGREVERSDIVGDEAGRGLSHRELGKWLRVAPKSGGRWWPLLGLMWITGARFGEATALQWKHLDLKTGLVRIRRSVWSAKDVRLPKSKRGIRDTFLVGAPLETIRKAHEAVDAKPDDLVFFSPESEHGFVHAIGPRKAMLHTLNAADIDQANRPTLHMLRHTYNNHLRKVADGVVRQALMGHADEKVGLIYSAADAKERREAQEKVHRRMMEAMNDDDAGEA